MKKISTPNAPAPAGHYSQGVVHAGTVFVSGQLAGDPAGSGPPPQGAGAQTRKALHNVGAVLEAAGSSLAHVLQMTIYVTDVEFWPDVNEAFADVMGDHRPARAVVPVGPLKGEFLVEIQAVAALK